MSTVATRPGPGAEGRLIPKASAPGPPDLPDVLRHPGPLWLEGRLHHQRLRDRAHEFTYGLSLAWFDPDDPNALRRSLPRRSPARWYDRDAFGDRPPGVSIREFVGDLVAVETGEAVHHVRGLTQLRTFGWLFNPITFWFAYGRPTDHRLPPPLAVVLEVTNTPWHETHLYVIDLRAPRPHHFAKVLHVSPFMEMDQTYEFDLRGGPDRLTVRLDSHQDGRKAFGALLALRAHPMTPTTTWAQLRRHPVQTLAVSSRIYVHAARLLARGQSFVKHPRR